MMGRYDGAMTAIRPLAREASEFLITMGLHQGSCLSPCLFVLAMDKLTTHIQDDVPWYT